VDLLKLTVGVVVGHRFDHLDPTAAQFGPDRLEAGYPVFGLQCLKGHADAQRTGLATPPQRQYQQPQHHYVRPTFAAGHVPAAR